MKKLALFLLVFLMAVVGISCTAKPTVVAKDDGAVAQTKSTAPLSSLPRGNPIATKTVTRPSKPAPPPVEEVSVEPDNFRDDIPLTHEEQEWLRAACEEFDVPYALALGLIEKETVFRNVVGDDGASTGYMQIQQKWHWDRMERLGVTDLLEPNGNFRVGCDFLSELYGKYNDWSVALTVYNMGHNPGFVTDYAKEVMENYAHWQERLENYI